MKPDEEEKKQEVKGELADVDPLNVPPFDPNGPPNVDHKKKTRKNYEFVAPNKALFKDNFWTQEIVNHFMKKNWGQNDPNYKNNLKIAQFV